jgi:hypothetical protein
MDLPALDDQVHVAVHVNVHDDVNHHVNVITFLRWAVVSVRPKCDQALLVRKEERCEYFQKYG